MSKIDDNPTMSDEILLHGESETGLANNVDLMPPTASTDSAQQSPIEYSGGMGWLGGGTINLDHFLGGMPLNLRELPALPSFAKETPIQLPSAASNPEGAEEVVYDVNETGDSPFSTDSLPPPVRPAPPSPPELPSPTPFVPVKPDSVDIFPLIAKRKSSKPRIAPIPRHAVIRSAPLARQKSPLSPPIPQTPPVLHTDVFSSFVAAPTVDPAFGGGLLNHLDLLMVAQSPESAEPTIAPAEHDFADDDFWNRTDEEDDLRQSSQPDVLNPSGW